MAAEYTLYTMKNCPWCDKIKVLLKEHNIDYKELEYQKDFTRDEFVAMLGPSVRPSLPKLYVDGNMVGGYEETVEFLKEGK